MSVADPEPDVEPHDPQLLQAVGLFVVQWSKIEQRLKFLFGRVLGLTPKQTVIVTRNMRTQELIDGCERAAVATLEANEAESIRDWLKLVRDAVELRNGLMHGTWARKSDGTKWRTALVSFRLLKRKNTGKVEVQGDIVTAEEVLQRVELLNGLLAASEQMPKRLLEFTWVVTEAGELLDEPGDPDALATA